MHRLLLAIPLLIATVVSACNSRPVIEVGVPAEEVPAGPVTDPEKIDPPAPALPICSPLPNAWTLTDLEPPEEAMGDCPLQGWQRNRGDDLELAHIVTFSRTEYELERWSTYPKLNQTEVNRYRFDGGGRVIYRQLKSTSATPHTRAYDDDGHLVMDKSSYQTMTQVFDKGRLVERLVVRDNGTETRLTWSYDQAGRMTVAEGVSTGSKTVTARADWKYDGAGRPIEVIRQRDGAVHRINRWSYGEENKLVNRTIVTVSHPAHFTQLLDNYEGQKSFNMFGYDYGVAQFPDDCHFPGVSLTDGYPGYHYDLGWTRLAEEEPASDTVHWNRQYANHELYGFSNYYYVPPIWATHDLLSTPWTSTLKSEQVIVEIDYNAAGENTSEQIYGLLPDFERGDLLHQRSRAFEDGRLVQDRVRIGATESAAAVQRTLEFQYDSANRLIRRELLENEVLLAYQSWSFDQAGHHLGHTVFLPYVDGNYWVSETGPTEGFEVTEHGQIGRQFDDAGRMIQSWSAGPKGDKHNVWNYAFHESGVVSEAATGAKDGSSRTEYRFDTQGREILRWSDYKGVRSSSAEKIYRVDGRIERMTSYNYGADGKKTVGNMTRYHYACQ